jgi:hypothetical protein
MATAKKAKKGESGIGADFDKRNFLILGIGLAIIILGFIFLASGDITVAPILLVVGYCIVIPLGILLPNPKTETDQVEAEKESKAV